MMNVHSEILDSGGRRSLRFDSHIDIERSAEEVFAYVSDQLNAPEWEHGLSRVVRLTPGPIGVGSEHEFTRVFLGRTVKGRNRFVQFDPGRYFEFVMTGGGMDGRASYLVEPTGKNSSRVTSTVAFDLGRWERIVRPALQAAMKRAIPRDDQTLKRRLESGSR